MSEEMVNKKEYVLSILIPSLTERVDRFGILIKKIMKQIEDCGYEEVVQIISHIDNRSVPLKDKRNKMMKRARGTYLCHIDDDDDVSDNFIEELVPICLEHEVDVITYNQLARLEKGDIFLKSSLRCGLQMCILEDYPNAKEGEEWFIRFPWQFHAWRTSLVKDIDRNDADNGPKCEDVNWLKRVMLSYPETQYDIDKVLHIFNGRRDLDCPSACGWS